MTMTETTTVYATPGTEGNVIEALVLHMRDAYQKGGPEAAHVFAYQILVEFGDDDIVAGLLILMKEANAQDDIDGARHYAAEIMAQLGDEPMATNPSAAALVQLYLAWTSMIVAGQSTDDPGRQADLYREADEQIGSVLHILLERDDLFTERITAECYQAYIAYRLGDAESGRRKMDLVHSALVSRSNMDAQIVYLETRIALEHITGAPLPVPTEGMGTVGSAVTAILFPESDPGKGKLNAASPEATLRTALATGDMRRIFDVTTRLLSNEPDDVTQDMWFAVRHAHTRALQHMGAATSDAQERKDLFNTAVSVMQDVVLRASELQRTNIYVVMAVDLVYVLHMLDAHTEEGDYYFPLREFILANRQPGLMDLLRQLEGSIGSCRAVPQAANA
jgi:phage-related protein